MAAPVKISYPDIPASATAITDSHAEDSDFPTTNLIDSGKALIARRSAATGDEYTSTEYDLGTGNTETADHVILGRADLLVKDKVTGFAVKGSRRPATTIDDLLTIDVFQHWDASVQTGMTIDSTTRRVTDWDSQTTAMPELFLYCYDMSDPAWTKTNVTMKKAVANPIDGGMNGYSMNENTSAAAHSLDQDVAVVNTTQYKFQIYVKSGDTQRYCRLELATGFTASTFTDFDLSDGTVDTDSGGSTGAITALADGWYLISITATATSTTTCTATLYLQTSAAGSTSYTGIADVQFSIFRPSMMDQATQTASWTQATSADQPWLSRSDNLENRLIQSEDIFDSTYWLVHNTTIVGNVMYSDGGSAQHYLDTQTANRTIGIEGASMRLRVELEYVDHTYILLQASDSATNHCCNFDILTGVVDGQTAGVTGTITARTGGGYICEMAYTNAGLDVSPTGNVAIAFAEVGDTAIPTFSMTADTSVIIHNIQICEAAADNTYIRSDGHPWFRGANGLSRLIFDGTNTWMTTNTIVVGNQPRHIFFVIKYDYEGTQNDWFDGSAGGVRHLAGVNPTSQQVIIGAGTNLLGTASTTADTFYVIEALFDDTAGQLFIDGVTDNSGTVGTDNPTQWTLGASYADTVHLLGSVCEIIVMNDYVSDYDIAEIREYLADKWQAEVLAQTSSLATETLQGPASQDLIKVAASESTAYRYWTIYYYVDHDETSKITHSDLNIGTFYDFGDRGPNRSYTPPSYTDISTAAVVSTSGSQFRARANQIANTFSLTWKILASNKDEFHNKIAKYWDVRPVWLYSASSSQILSEHTLLKCWIESYSIEAEAAASEVYTISVNFREDVTP